MLDRVRQDVCKVRGFYNVHWYCLFDDSKFDALPAAWPAKYSALVPGDRGGGGMRNKALDIIQGGYVYFLDDDNKLNDSMTNDLPNVMDDMESGVVYSQLLGDGQQRLIADRNCVRYGNIDAGQYVLSRDAIGDIRQRSGEYASDFYFIDEVIKNLEVKFWPRLLFKPDIHTYYNYYTTGGK